MVRTTSEAEGSGEASASTSSGLDAPSQAEGDGGERGSTRHNPRLDDELTHETQGLVQGQPGPGHAEEWRQTEPMPDDTDAPDATEAMRLVGDLHEAPDVAASAGDDEVETAPADAAAPSPAVGPDGDFATADTLSYSTETHGDVSGDEPGADGRLEVADQDALGADAIGTDSIGTDSPGSRPTTSEEADR